MNIRPAILALVIAAGIGVGAVGMALVAEPSANEPPPAAADTAPVQDAYREAVASQDPDQLAAVVESLVTMLDQEISERQVLAEEIRSLKADVARLENTLGTSNVAVVGEARITSRVRPDRNQQAQQRRERLLSAGFTQRDLEEVERRSAEATIKQMELDDRARREGWVNTPRYFEEARALQTGPAAARGYLGDEAYDRYLFASGLPNRLRINNVIATSAAERAGLQSGDIVLSYDGSPVFTTQELVEMRSGGEPGTSVTMTIMRGDETMEVTMPRGPIGINTGPMVVDPLGPLDSG